MPHVNASAIAEHAIQAVMSGSIIEVATCVHPTASNRMSRTEPPATRGIGPSAFHATGDWLRAAFSDLAWHTETTVVHDDMVVSYGNLSGQHTGNFEVWTPDGTLERVFAPTGKHFTTPQAHFQRIADGLVIEHWAVRDDQGMAQQLGWIPPTLGYLLRCRRATKRARAAAAESLNQPQPTAA